MAMRVSKQAALVVVGYFVLSCILVVLSLKIIELTHNLHEKEVESAGLCLWMLYNIRNENVSDKVKNRHLAIELGCLDRLESVCADDESYVVSLLSNKGVLDAVSYTLEITSMSNALYKINTNADPVKYHMNYPKLHNLLRRWHFGML